MPVDKPVRRFHRAAPRLRGFTLIEVVVVVAIVAILAAIAVPIYSENVRKSRRGQAKALVVELAQRFERFHTVNNTYVGAFAAVVPAVDRQSPNIAGATSAYTITNPVVTANTFTLRLTPVGQQLKDTKCLTMNLNQAGVKTESGSGSLSDCW